VRLLPDQGLPRFVASLLQNQGIDASHVGEIDMAARQGAYTSTNQR